MTDLRSAAGIESFHGCAGSSQGPQWQVDAAAERGSAGRVPRLVLANPEGTEV